MGTIKYTDDAYTTIAASVGATDSIIIVTSSARFSNLLTIAGDYFYATIVQTGTGNKETVKVSNITGTSWAVTRAVGPNDSNLSFAVGDGVYLRVCTNVIHEIRSASNQTKALFTIAGGSSDAITATVGIAPQTLVDGTQVNIRVISSNSSTTPTFNLNNFGACIITKQGGNALAPGDIVGEVILRYVAAGTRWELLNPVWPTETIVHSLSVANANGLVGSSSGGKAPQLTLSTTVTGILKGNGLAISGATDGGDFLSPVTGVTVSQTAAQNIGTTSNRLGKLWATDITCTNTINGNSATASAASTVTGLTVTSGKALTVNNSVTLSGTDGVTVTLPATNATLAATNLAQTHTGMPTFAGGIAFAVTTKPTSYTIAATDYLVLMNGSSLTVTLPSAASYPGRVLKLGAVSSAVTIANGPLYSTDGSTVVASSINARYIIEIMSNGAVWLYMNDNWISG